MKRKKYIRVLAMLLVASLFFASGCGKRLPKTKDGTEDPDKDVKNIASRLLEERFETFPENAAILSYEIDPEETFRVADAGDENSGRYVIRGGYQCVYGWSAEKPILEMSVEADFLIEQDPEGDWNIESITPVKIESDAEKRGKGWITSIDESSSVFFIRAEEADDKRLNIPAAANKLLGGLMMKLSDYDSEKATFMLSHASAQTSGMEQIAIPKERKDIKICWKIKDGIVGSYLGYMGGLGYAVPMLQEDFESEDITLNQKPLYFIKKQDGFYLESDAVFEGRVKGRIFEITNG